MVSVQLSNSLSDFLAAAVKAETAPGLVAVAFNRDGSVAEAAQGTRDITTKEPMTLDTVVWMASMSKALTSLTALVLVEEHSFDLDSHDALVQLLPELALHNSRPISKIFDGKDEEGKWKLRDAEVGITLRHLLTHTSGLGYEFTSEEHKDLYVPHGSVPSVMSGLEEAYDVPRSFETGTGWLYGVSADWVARFVERINKSTLRRAQQDLVLTPLGIAPDTLDSFRSEKMNENRATVSFKAGESLFVVPPQAVDTPQFEGTPPAGHAVLGSAALHGTVPAYATFLRALLNATAPSPGAKPLISAKLWADVSSDNLARHYNISLPTPVHTSWNGGFSNSVARYSEALDGTGAAGEGWTALQTMYSREASAAGGAAGTLRWAGLANSYYFVDQESGVGGAILAQFIPWADAGMVALKDRFEEWVYANVKA